MTEAPLVATDGRIHACLSVADLDATAAWYRTVLGFRIFQRFDYTQFPVRVAYLRLGEVELELVEAKGAKADRRGDPPADHVARLGISQLSFRVADAKAAAATLAKHGISAVFGPVHAPEFNLNAFFVRDNEGNLVEFIERLP
jgi:catechol 2,3-dioxygenase-like lactoylglutathione lyase family enzyme